MELYMRFSWRERFQTASASDTEEEHLLEAIGQQSGSIGRVTADTLHLTAAQLRQRIEDLDLQEAINRIRKKSGRRPAQFHSPSEALRYRVYEPKLPARY